VPRPNSAGKSANLAGPVQARLTRYFDVAWFAMPPACTFGADSFNLSNTPYFQRPGQNLASTNFGVTDTAVGERIVQFALRLTF
jgi:hypothetical protein